MAYPRLSRGLTIFMRILFAIMIAAVVMMGVLRLLARTGDPLRQGIERAIADMTQSHVYLEALPNPEFFPNVHLTLQNIAISDKDDATQRLGSAQEIEFSVPFLRAASGFTRFTIFRLKDIRVEKGVLFPRALRVADGRIDTTGPAPVLALTGALGDAPAQMRVDLSGSDGKTPSYIIPPDAGVVVTLGRAVVEGKLTNSPDGLMLKDTVLKGDGATYGPQDFFILKNQQFVKDNPVSCLMDQEADSRLTQAHPCATLFDRETVENTEEDQE